MELKRRYKQIPSCLDKAFPLKQKNWIERNISLTGFGEDLLRPTLVGIAIVILSTFFFVTQSNPSLIPNYPSSFLIIKKIQLPLNTSSNLILLLFL
jgi:hypothetical protein